MQNQNPTPALVSAIMHSTEPMVLTDPTAADHPMIAVNAAFEALTGYTREQTVGRNCRFLQGEGTDPKTPARIRSCLDRRRGCIEWIVNYRADGSLFWNLLFLSPVFGPDGTLLHYFGNQRDITEGPPANLPDYSLGMADLSIEGETAFYKVLRGLGEGEAGAHTLQAAVDAARRLNDLTVRLAPAPWSMPG